MKIVKLGDICSVTTGNMNKQDQVLNGKYNFYTRSTNVLKSNNFTVDYECTIIPGEGIFTPIWNKEKAAIHQRVYIIKSDENILINKYLYYWWCKNNHLLYQKAVGSTVKSLRKNNFTDELINLPSIEIQQHIVDTITFLFLKFLLLYFLIHLHHPLI